MAILSASAKNKKHANASNSKTIRKVEAQVLRAEDLRDRLNDRAHEAGEKVRELYDQARGEVQQVAQNVTNRINDKPVQSSVIALAAGFFIGALFARR